MTDNMPTAGRPAATPKLTECSPGLIKQLAGGRDPEGNGYWLRSWAAMAADPEARAVVAEHVEALEARAAPCSRPALIAILLRLVPVFGVSDREAEEWATFWGVYGEALEDLPEEALREAAKAFVKLPDAKFFPKPGELRALAEPLAADIRGHARGARAILSVPADQTMTQALHHVCAFIRDNPDPSRQ